MDYRADVAAILSSAVAERHLHYRDDITEAGWSFWELRTLNMHRVVGLLRAHRQFDNPRDLEQDVRSAVGRHFKRSWWRGMAYGIVIEAASLQSFDGLQEVVDARDNSKGTFQWVVLLAPDAPVVIGVHTWIEGFLSPVFRNTLDALRRERFDVTSVTRPKDGLMTALTEVADLRAAITSFNVRQQAFPEFRDRD